MRQLLRKSWKRVTAMVLAFAMILTGLHISDTTANAANTDITITGVGQTNYDGRLLVWLTTSATLPAGSFSGLEVYADGSKYDSSLLEVMNDAGMLLLVLWNYNQATPANGSTITLKAGTGTNSNGNINITQDFTAEYNDGTWAKQEATANTNMTITGVGQTNYDGRLLVWLNTSATLPVGSFSGLEVYADGSKYDSSLLEVMNDAGMLLLVLWNYNQATPANGSTITLKAGAGTNANGNITITEDFTMEYNDGAWAKQEVSTNTDMTITGVGQTSFVNDANPRWLVWLDTSATLPEGAFAGLEVYIDGSKYTGGLEILKDDGRLLLVLWNYSEATPATGSTITLKAGTGTNANGNITITEDFTMEYSNGAWVDEDTQIVQDTEMTITGLGEARFVNDGSPRWLVWLDTSATLPEGAFAGLEVYIDESKYTGGLEILKDNGRLLLVLWNYSEAIPATGSTITLKAGTGTNANGNIKITEDYTIEYNGSTWVEEGAIIEYQDFTFGSINAATGYNAEHGWFFYLVPSTELPGTIDKTFFTGIKMSVNGGEKFDIPITKSSHAGTAFFVVPKDKLAENITSNTTIVIHSGQAVSNDGSDGIQLKADFTIYANQYGMSTSGFTSKETMIQTGATISLDTATAFGGNENGVYVNTTDKFPADTTWATHIKAVTYDNNSGVFLNGEKLNSPIIRYADGRAYIALADAGVAAKDKDKLTVKGTFVLNGNGVSYNEVSFYYNGKLWNTKYEPAKPETYKQLAAQTVNAVSGWNAAQGRWDVYLNVNAMIPGEIDKMEFKSLIVEINGKQIETPVYHSYQHTLWFPIWKTDLSENCKDGTKITLKAGKALAGDRATGIQLTKDFTFYTYKGSITELQPTTNTTWQDVTITGMLATGRFNSDAKTWNFHLKLRKPLTTATGTIYLQLPITINGKTYHVKAQQDGEYLYISIPENILSGNTKKATISIAAGAKAYTNAGRDGIKITDAWTTYLFNGAISEHEFTEVETTETKILGLQNVTPYNDGYHVYLRLNKEFPGTPWYENYDDFEYYYNGKKITCTARKSDSSNNKFMYFPIETAKVGTPKEGDIVTIKEGMVFTCGGYEVKVLNDFMLMYSDGIWSQYMETDVKAPADNQSLWAIARFAEGYIPVSDNGSVLYTNEDKYNAISSIEPMKDYTVSFNVKKMYDDETTPSFGVILRGNAVSDEEAMTKDLLYGYVVTFSALEVKENEDSESVWTGYLNLWKNGENHSLLDQYRISYIHDQSDHPYFQYEKDYNYEFSIYNITETCVCITVKVNDKLVMRYYDEAGSDPFDPAVNAGTFQVYAGSPNYTTDDIVELDEVISEKAECEVGNKVRVAATYPSVLEGAEFSVDKDGATVENGTFVATKPGTYTVSCTYNGKELTSKTITVTEAETTDAAETGEFPIVPVVVVAVIVVLAAVGAIVLLKKRNKEKLEEGNE